MGVKPFALGNKPATLSPVTVSDLRGDGVTMENAFVKVHIRGGRLVSCWDKISERDVISNDQEGNVFKLFEDIPLFWDAWDVEVYHLEKGWEAPIGETFIEEEGPIRAVVLAKIQITPTSFIEQRIILTAADSKIEFDTNIKWDENRVMLKVEFPLAINCDYATYETQFGYIQRPTHYNNSWDLARFEVCGHKYADLSEYGFGVALLNDCKYGYSVKDNVMRLSLLRSPKAPDGHCDIGSHRLRYALYPHKGSFLESDVVRQAYQFNVPLSALRLLVDPSSENLFDLETFQISTENIVLDTVKIAEDPRPSSAGVDTVIRLYEAYGGRGVCVFSSAFTIKEARYCNILEDIGESVEFNEKGHL
ncbi:Alpha-mannosidase 2C1, partial [Dinochytrium kinnereticum]